MDIVRAVTTWISNNDRLLIILPLASAYLLGSSLSLRTWIAAQRVPIVAKTEFKEVENKLDKRTIISLCAVISFLLVSVFCESLLDVIFASVAVLSSLPLMTVLLALLIGFRLSLHLESSGDPVVHFRYSDYTFKRRALFIAIVFLGVKLQLAAIWYKSNIGASVMLVMALYAFEILKIHRTQISIRHTIKLVFVCESILLFYKTLFCFIRRDEEASLEKPHWSETNSFSDWVYVVMVAFPLSSLFSLFLRFDYANHVASLETIQGSPIDIGLEEVPAVPEEQLSAGVVIPTTIPFCFKCPYFISAFLGWFFANFAVAQLISLGIFLYPGRLAHAIGVLYIAPPVMFLSVVAVSLMRGEMERMWNYEEQWGPKPIDQAAVEDNVKVEKQVPAEKESTQIV